MTTDLNQKEIAERAYQIWETSGRPFGQEMEHWLKAEAELSAAQSGTSRGTLKNPSPSISPQAKQHVDGSNDHAARQAVPAREKSRERRRPESLAA